LWQKLDSRFKLSFLGASGQKGHGPSVARNHGLALVCGQVVAFCDDDDYWFEPAHISMMFGVFSNLPDTDMYIANQRAVLSTGEVKSADWLPQLCALVQPRVRQNSHGHLVTVADLCQSGGFAHLNTLAVRKPVIDQVHGFWEKVSYEEDRDFFWRAADCCKQIFFNPTVVAQHNIPDPKKQSNQSTTHSWIERWMLATLVSQHISVNVKNALIAQAAVNYEGDLNRKLATQFATSGRFALAWAFGKRALATRFSFKWLGYLALLRLKALAGSAAT
jgi:glycosyltransferase involved in cell wall biosynthesis